MNFIVVLGNSKANVMNKRMDSAIATYRSFEAPGYIIVSGTQRETDIMVIYLSKYVDGKCIIVENKSKNTIENIINSKNIVDQYYRNVRPELKPIVTICTSTFHIKRTILITRFITDYNTRFIHTNEQVSIDEYNSEMYKTDVCLNNIAASLC